MLRLRRKYQTMRLWWSQWKTSFIIPSTLTMHALQVKQRKPQAWEKHCQKGTNQILIVRTSAIFGETGDFSFTIYCPNSGSRWAVDGTNTEIGYGSTLSSMFFWRILCPAFLNGFLHTKNIFIFSRLHRPRSWILSRVFGMGNERHYLKMILDTGSWILVVAERTKRLGNSIPLRRENYRYLLGLGNLASHME